MRGKKTMTTWRGKFIGLLACAVAMPLSARAEVGVAGTSSTLGSVGLVGVKVGDDFRTAGKNLHGCRAVDIAGKMRMTCRSATAVGGLKFSALTYEARGGARVNKVTASGTKPRSC